MNLIDLILGVGIGWTIFKGWTTGLFRSLAGVLGLMVGYFVSFSMGHRVGALITGSEDPGAGAVLVGFIAAFIATLIAFYFLGRFLSAYIQHTPFGVVDSVAGGTLGLVKGVLVFGVLLMVVRAYPYHSGVKDSIDEALLAAPVQKGALALVDVIRAIAPRAGDLLKQLDMRIPDDAPDVVDGITTRASQAGEKLDGLVEETRTRLK